MIPEEGEKDHGPFHRVGQEEEEISLFDDPTTVTVSGPVTEVNASKQFGAHNIFSLEEARDVMASSDISALVDYSVSASMGAMRPLVGKLDMLLLNPHGCSNSNRVNNGMRLLKEEVEEISSYLDELAEVEDPPPTAKCWMNEVRDLSYEMEDYIDGLLFVPPHHFNKNKNKHMKMKRRKKKKSITSHVKIPKRLKWCKQISYVTQVSDNGKSRTRSVCRNIDVLVKRWPEKIEVPEMTSEFRMCIQEAIERYHRYEIHRCSITSSNTSTLSIGRMLPTPPNISIVIDGRMNEFIKSIKVAANDTAAHQQQLKVVSIVGSGCIGKTTLAKVLYNTVGGQFDCRAFIWVSKNPDIRRLFRDLFSQLHGKQPPDNCNQLGIRHNISTRLRDKRYLIIIDDLWAASVWDIIKYVFPKGNRGSTIIVTTQIEDLALTCCSHQSEHVFEMKPLDDDHSRKLFNNSLFGSETDCPAQFKEVSDKIVEMCGGLPLATVSMARLLANQQLAVPGHLVTHILDSLRSPLLSNSTSERTRQILNLSFNNLPQYLKTFLLYLVIYPAGSIFCKNDVVNQWVAEGFITTRDGQDIEELAGFYFDQLVDRRFIEPMYVSFSNKVVSCTVHEVVRDLIAQKSAEVNFIVVADHTRKNMELTHKVRRLSLLFDDSIYSETPANIRKSQVRSLTFFGLLECLPCIGHFKLVRVLNLQLSGHPRGEQEVVTDLTGISELLHLRYLKVASNVCIKLPDCMRGLHFLEIMDATRVTAVPWDIIHLPNLLHLTLPLDTNLLGWIDIISEFAISLWGLGKLNSLQDLHLTSSSSTSSSDHLERSMEALGSLVGGHGNLKNLVVAHEDVSRHKKDSGVIISWDGLAPPPLLERFEFSPHSGYIFTRVPMWMGQLGNLCILKIVVRELLRHGVDILRGLPALTALSLYVQREPAKGVVFGKEGFSVLNYFKFSCSVPWLIFEAHAMPNLWKLKLGFSAPAGENQHKHGSISIYHLPGLKEINAKIGAAATGADAVAALRAVVRNHPSNPGIKVQLADSTSYGDKTYSRIYRLLGISPYLTVPGLNEYDLAKIMDEQETHDLYCPNCKSCITRRVILQRKKERQTARLDEPPKTLQLAETSGSEEYDLEKILNEQQTYDMYCPNCKSCITRRMIQKKRRRSRDLGTPSAADTGRPFSQDRSLTQDEWEILHTVREGIVKLVKKFFPAHAKASNPAFSESNENALSCHVQASWANRQRLPDQSSSQHQTTTIASAASTSSHTSSATGIFHTDVIEMITGEMPPAKPAAHHLLGQEGIIPRADILTSPMPLCAAPPHVAVSVSEDVNQRDDWDILKAIVYGGLVESVTSLSVVLAAASCGAKTLSIFILGIANLIGGLPPIFHNIAQLRDIQDFEWNDEQVGHYWLQLGRRSKAQLHMVLALLSYIFFGLLPPVLYGLSFRGSNDRVNKMIAVAGASLACIALLALGKAHVKSRPRTYFKTLMYYLTIAVSSSGLSYVAGALITRLLVHCGIIDQGGASAPPSVMFPRAVGAETSAWASF